MCLPRPTRAHPEQLIKLDYLCTLWKSAAEGRCKMIDTREQIHATLLRIIHHARYFINVATVCVRRLLSICTPLWFVKRLSRCRAVSWSSHSIKLFTRNSSNKSKWNARGLRALISRARADYFLIFLLFCSHSLADRTDFAILFFCHSDFHLS